jgi:hypothetical protein
MVTPRAGGPATQAGTRVRATEAGTRVRATQAGPDHAQQALHEGEERPDPGVQEWHQSAAS